MWYVVGLRGCLRLRAAFCKGYAKIVNRSWSNRTGIIWNVQNRQWQHMRVRHGHGSSWVVMGAVVKILEFDFRAQLNRWAEWFNATVSEVKLHAALQSFMVALLQWLMLKSLIYWKVNRIYFQTMILIITVSLIIDLWDIKPWAYSIDTQLARYSSKLPLSLPPAGAWHIAIGLPDCRWQSGRPAVTGPAGCRGSLRLLLWACVSIV